MDVDQRRCRPGEGRPEPGALASRVTSKVGLCGFTMAAARYLRHFPVVEVQQTFYQPPQGAVIERWPPRPAAVTVRGYSSDALIIASASQFSMTSRAPCARCAGTVMRWRQPPSAPGSKRPHERIAPRVSSSRTRPRAAPS